MANLKRGGMAKKTFLPRDRTVAGLAVLVLCLLIAGCSQSTANSDQDRRNGFYGGISGGMQ
jgi:hypothetical protein